MDQFSQLILAGRAEDALAHLKSAMRERPAETGALAKAATASLLDLYDRFVCLPVEEFADLLPLNLPAPIAEAMGKFLNAPIARGKAWRATLEEVTRERLVRESRAAVTVNDPKEAARLGAALLARGARAGADASRLARGWLAALATLRRDRERALEAVRALAASPEGKASGVSFAETFEKLAAAPAERAFEESNKAWTRALDAAVASIRDYCPGPRSVGEPTPEDLQKFSLEMMSVLRAGLAEGGVGEDFIDALAIVKDFCPCDPSILPSLAGVEPRVFLSLGARGKLTAVRSLQAIGANDALRARILELAASPEGKRRIDLLAAVMGGLRHDDFFPYLKASLKHANSPRLEEAVVDALGRIGNPQGVDLIIGLLAEIMKKTPDPSQAKRAKMLLTALGRIGRAKGIEPKTRNAIAKSVIAATGEKSAHIAAFAAEQMFTTAPEEIDPGLRAWGVKQLCRAMFGMDSGEDLQASARSRLGFREPLAAALRRIGKDMLPEIIADGAPHATAYSGAFLAFAEVMEKVGDERALPVLETMARAALHYQEPAEGRKLYKEMVHDAESDELRELDRDQVTHALLYAIEKIGGEAGARILLGFADQVQAGQLPSPGENTSSFLFQQKRKAGTIGKIDSAPDPAASEISEKEIEKAAAAARGGMLTSKRAQIEAIALLGRARRPATVGALLSAMQSKDAVIRGAAETALVQFVTPPPSSKEFEAIAGSIFAEKKALKGELLDRVIALIEKNFPKRPPYDAAYKRALQIEIEPGPLAHRLACAIQLPAAAAPKPAPAESAAADGDQESGAPALAIKSGREAMDELQKKRAWLEERRKWIAGGKKGPEPKPPE